jgi:hypothetical protein
LIVNIREFHVYQLSLPKSRPSIPCPRPPT